MSHVPYSLHLPKYHSWDSYDRVEVPHKQTDDDVIVDLLYGGSGRVDVQDKQQGERRMSEYDNNNTGALYKKTDPKSSRSPHMTGPLEVDDVKYHMSSWKRSAPSLGAYYSISVSEKTDDGWETRGEGELWPFDSDNEKAPKFKGQIKLGGVEYPVSAWVREPSGKVEHSYLSLRLEEEYEYEEVDDPDGALDF